MRNHNRVCPLGCGQKYLHFRRLQSPKVCVPSHCKLFCTEGLKETPYGHKAWKFQIFFFGWLLWVLLKQKAKCQVILRFAPNRDPYLAECHSLWCRWLLTSFHKEGSCCGVCKLTKKQNKNNKKKYNIKSVVLHGRGHYTAVTLQLN